MKNERKLFHLAKLEYERNRQQQLQDMENQQTDPAELYTAWSDIEREWKKAEDDVKQSTGIVRWSASHVPKIPPGVPLLLSQLAEQPGQAAAWGTCGAPARGLQRLDRLRAAIVRRVTRQLK